MTRRRRWTPKTTHYTPIMQLIAPQASDPAAWPLSNVATDDLTFNHVFVTFLCACLVSVCQSCNVRTSGAPCPQSCDSDPQGRRLRHVLMWDGVMCSATLTAPLPHQTVMTFISCLSGHHCGATGFNLLRSCQSAFLSWPSYSGMFIQVHACLLVVCSERHRVSGRANLMYVTQPLNTADRQKGPLWKGAGFQKQHFD